MYQLYEKDGTVISKKYPYKMQAIVKAYLLGYVVTGRGKKWLTCEIRKV